MSGAIAIWLVGLACCAEPAVPHPLTNPESALMLDLPGSGADPTKIDFATLPVLRGRHAVVSVGDCQWQFRLHNYLARYDGRFWCFWSHGPVIEDKATQHLRYATSSDGLEWSLLVPDVHESGTACSFT